MLRVSLRKAVGLASQRRSLLPNGASIRLFSSSNEGIPPPPTTPAPIYTENKERVLYRYPQSFTIRGMFAVCVVNLMVS